MGMEVFIVCAHAMGRMLVLPPQQNLYLLYRKHKGINLNLYIQKYDSLYTHYIFR